MVLILLSARKCALALQFLGISALLAGAASANPLSQCETRVIQNMVADSATIASANRIVGGECRIYGYVTTNDPTPNQVNFVLNLPQNFNGRYVFLGVGGAAGRLPRLPADLVAQGYALAGTDSGTGATTAADFSFFEDPAKTEDYLWRGVYVSARATQAITKAYYDNDGIYRYISGCSGGGQMGLGNARRFGKESFDGFLVGATPWPATLHLANTLRIVGHVQNNPDGWIPPDLIERAHKAIIDAYDDTDGAVDGIIWDERNIEEFDLSILRDLGFTPQQIETFEVIRQPYTFPSGGLRGDGAQPGIPVTSIAAWPRYHLGHKSPPWPGTDSVSPAELQNRAAFYHILTDTRTRAYRPGLNYWEIDDYEKIIEVTTRGGRDVPFEDPMDFSKVHDSGARMIIWHGVNDEAMSYLDSLAGTEAIWERFPGSRNWLGYYAIPGLEHCRGGDGPNDFITPLIDELAAWVERDETPGRVVTGRYNKDRGLEREFLLCPEPYRAQLKDSKHDPLLSENWQCLDQQGNTLE